MRRIWKYMRITEAVRNWKGKPVSNSREPWGKRSCEWQWNLATQNLDLTVDKLPSILKIFPSCTLCVRVYIYLWKVKVLVAQSCPTLLTLDSRVTPWTVACQAPLSMGILQARILERAAMPSSRGSSWPKVWTRALMSPTLAGGLFSSSATMEAHKIIHGQNIKFIIVMFCGKKKKECN